MSTLGQRVRRTRKKKDLLQKDVAKRAGISTPFMSDIENDKRNISSQVLCRLSDALDVTMHWLMTGTEWNGEVEVDEETEVPRHLEAVASKQRWSYSETVDVLRFVEYASQRSDNFRRPKELSPDDWKALHDVFERVKT